MNDKKPTNNEIIQQVRYFADHYGKDSCLGNPSRQFWVDVLSLINYLQAKVEELKTENRILSQKRFNIFERIEFTDKLEKQAKAEAYQEFAERLETKLFIADDNLNPVVTKVEIDGTYKELVGEK